MFGLTPFGLFHTLLGVVALVSGFGTLVREKQIGTRSLLGRVYVIDTLLVATTGLAIFNRGGFGIPHRIAIATICAIAVGLVAENSQLFRGLSRYVMTFAYSATLLFHLMPTFAEGLSRLPPRAPLAASPEDPLVGRVIATLGITFAAALLLQLRWVHRQRKNAITA
jgi:hypothetical protein